MRPRALLLTCALASLPAVASSVDAPDKSPSRDRRRDENALRLELEPSGPAKRGQRLKVRVKVVNASDREVAFVDDRHHWVLGYGFHAPGIMTGIGWTAFAATHRVYDGKEICPDASLVSRLAPGGALLRELDVSLEGAPAGTVKLTVLFELITMPPEQMCGKALVERQEASTDVTVIRARGRARTSGRRASRSRAPARRPGTRARRGACA